MKDNNLNLLHLKIIDHPSNKNERHSKTVNKYYHSANITPLNTPTMIILHHILTDARIPIEEYIRVIVGASSC